MQFTTTICLESILEATGEHHVNSLLVGNNQKIMTELNNEKIMKSDPGLVFCRKARLTPKHLIWKSLDVLRFLKQFFPAIRWE